VLQAINILNRNNFILGELLKLSTIEPQNQKTDEPKTPKFDNVEKYDEKFEA